MIYRISGKDNKTAKSIKALHRKSGRTAAGRFVAEGRRICEEAFSYAPDRIYCTVMSESFSNSEPETVRRAESVSGRVFIASDPLFAAISDTDTPQGIMQVMEMDSQPFEVTGDVSHIAVLDGISEPGNMGTIIRTAEALGFDGLYLTRGCVDIYGSKTVRATMGSLFRMKFRCGCTADDIAELGKKGFSLYATSPTGETALEECTFGGRCAVIIGNEAHGVTDELLRMSDMRLRITMDGNAESLNAAAAAGIVMHWIKNRREG